VARYDSIIKGGTIIDGLQSGRFRGDVAIADGRIAAMGGNIDVSRSDQVLDATGLIVAPGFVDLHTHYDSQLFWDPYCTISGWHGVTSVAIGNCGFGFAPCRPADRERVMLTMTRNEAVPLKCMQQGMPWDWVTFPEFLDSIERTPKGVNVLSYVPIAPLFMYVMGPEEAKRRRPTSGELSQMCDLMVQAMDAGACGFSTQILGTESHQRDYDGTPMITDTMAEEDLLAFAHALGTVGRGFIQGLGMALATWEKVAEASGRPVLYNTVSVTTDQHGVPMEMWQNVLDWIHGANQRGHRIYGQATTAENEFQFTMEDWNLFDFSPVWREATVGVSEEKLQKLTDPLRRKAMKDEYDAGHRLSIVGPEGIPNIQINWVHDFALKEQDYEGRTIGEIAQREGKHPIDAFLDLVVADELKSGFSAQMITPSLRESKDYIQATHTVATDPYCIPGISDGGAHTKFMTTGTYPTDYIVDLVREQGAMSLEKAHWHLSALPAMAAGFKDRGYLREGMPADVVVYDFENLSLLPRERAYDYPAGEWRLVRKASGYRWILVNGVVTFADGEPTGATPGALLRHGSAKTAPAHV
jgi:N-acyl-D-amino-acid deacylase